MLHANAVDEKKISEVLESILTNALSHGQKIVFVNMRDFYSACRLSKLPRARFVEEVGDMLTSQSIAEVFGSWIIGEYGNGFHALCLVPKNEDRMVVKFPDGSKSTLIKL